MNQESKQTVGRDEFDDLIRRNVDAIARIEQAAHDNRTGADRIADGIAGFCGSPSFIYVHVLWFGLWLAWNLVGPKVARVDPPPFGVLTLVTSLEAIFLSTFILISQNRQQRTADQRNHLDLQINLLAEQETSQMLGMLKQVMDHLSIPHDQVRATALQQKTDPEELAQHIQEGIGPTDKED